MSGAESKTVISEMITVITAHTTSKIFQLTHNLSRENKSFINVKITREAVSPDNFLINSQYLLSKLIFN